MKGVHLRHGYPILHTLSRLLSLHRYVQYETKLEELRRLRKESRVLKGKKGLAESAIIRRIHFIYERATRKFRGDLRLWSAWLDFCKQSNSKRRLSQVTIIVPLPKPRT